MKKMISFLLILILDLTNTINYPENQLKIKNPPKVSEIFNIKSENQKIRFKVFFQKFCSFFTERKLVVDFRQIIDVGTHFKFCRNKTVVLLYYRIDKIVTFFTAMDIILDLLKKSLQIDCFAGWWLKVRSVPQLSVWRWNSFFG